MIKVEHLSKRFGRTTAVDDIAFRVKKGEIVGFLGPNGAGKTTTMRMLSGYLPPTSGRAEIAGCDIFHDSLRAREHIGYMPEHVPLPQHMRVREYLRFRAALKGIPGRRIKERLHDVYDLCALQGVERKLISALSKGFRQRVGLADAMIHEPDLLILDEPTIGLDPNQIRQVRELIRNLRSHHTILLSTHILSEVEMTCSRVLIINQGRIEAMDTPENLRARLSEGGEVVLEVRVDEVREAEKKLLVLSGVQNCAHQKLPGGWIRFTLRVEGDPRERLHALALAEKWPLRELSRRSATLEQVFFDVTHAEET